MNRYLEVRRRISTEKQPMSDAEIIESLDREIGEYRNKIVRMEDTLRAWKDECNRLKAENEELKEEAEGLSETVDKLSEKLNKTKNGKRVIVLFEDKISLGEVIDE